MFRQASWKSLALLSAFTLSACSKESNTPKVFLPTVYDQQGRNLDALRVENCGDGSHIDLRDHIVTTENFRAIFKCANYDGTLKELETLFQSSHFPKLVDSLTLLLKSSKDGKVKDLKDTLGDWLKEGPDGKSRADRLLPFLADMIAHPSFQDFLPVLDGILQAGRGIWQALFPGLADVIYNERFPHNIDDAMEIMKSFGGAEAKEEKTNYAKTVKDFARFLDSDVDGQKAAGRLLELGEELKKIELPDTKLADGKTKKNDLYNVIEHMLEKGTVAVYFLHAGYVRGEKVDPKLNASPDHASVACEGLNETPEQRQECAHRRMFQRTADGGDAPITQLAGLITELHKSHPDMLTDLASWVGGNKPRLNGGIYEYAVRFRFTAVLGLLKLDPYFAAFAQKQGLDSEAPVKREQMVDFVTKAFADPDFVTFMEKAVPRVNKSALGTKNSKIMQGAVKEMAAEIAALYAAKEVAPLAATLFKEADTTIPLSEATVLYGNALRDAAFLVEHNEKKQGIDRHLSDLWVATAKRVLGEEVVLTLVMDLAANFLTTMADEHKAKGQSIAEWYYTSPYGNPGTTEMLLSYAIDEFGLMARYKRHKEWLRGEWVDEVFTSDDDKRAARLLIDQLPNIILYVRSGMSRSGSDLTRAFNVDKDGFLVRSYVQIVEKVYETGWLAKGVRLIEAWQNRPGKREAAKPFVLSDEISERRKYTKGVEAVNRLLRSFIEPEREGDHSTSTLGRLMIPLSSIVSKNQRANSERFLLTSSAELLKLTDQQINDFFGDLNKAKVPGSQSERLETFRAASDLLRDKNFPDVVQHLSGLFQDKAVKPALDYLKDRYKDGSLPKLLLMIRRILGYSS